MKSVLLIGLGNVALSYDARDVAGTKVLSHARAFSRHPSFHLIGGVDIDVSRRDWFEQVYRLPSYKSIETAMRDLSPDIVVVATPTALHRQTVLDVFSSGRPKAILCEKPLAYNLRDAEQIAAACEKHNCSLYVNFFRQAEPGVAEIRERLADGRISFPLKGVVWYSRGIFNSGSHFLNLLQSLLGTVADIKIINPGRLWLGSDPEPDLEITFFAGRVVFLAAREEDFFHNSIELIAPNGRLRLESGGAQIRWQGVEEDKRFEGYRCISEIGETVPADFDHVQWHVVHQLAAAVAGKPANICSGAEALRTQEILNIIKERL